MTAPATDAGRGCSRGGPGERPVAGVSTAARGVAAMWRSKVRTASRPGRAGTCTTVAAGAAGTSTAGKQQGADPIARSRCEEAHGSGRGQDEVAFLARRGPELHAGGQVGQDPGLQLPVCDQIVDVGDSGACRNRPVHPPDVVTGAVLPAFCLLAAQPRQQAQVCAEQKAVQPPGDAELEPA